MIGRQLPFGPEIEPSIFIDPVLLPTLDHAADAQATLDLHPNASKAMRDDIVNELNAMWPRMEWPAVVSGKLEMPQAADDDNGYNREIGMILVDMDPNDSIELASIVDGERCVSQGFSIVEEGRIKVDGEDIGARSVIKLLFTRFVSIELPGYDETTDHEVDYVGDIDQLIIGFDEMSSEMAESLAREYFEAYTEQADMLCNQSTGTADKLTAMKDIDIAYEPYITTQEQEALRLYMQEMLGINEDDPEKDLYFVKFEDSLVLLLPGEADVPLEPDEVQFNHNELVRIHAVDVQPKLEVEIFKGGGGQLRALERILELRVVLQTLDRTPNSDSDFVAVRLSDIATVQNVRDVFHDARERAAEATDD